MRKSFWVILTVLVVAVGAPIAHADSFTATFTCTGSCSSTPTAPNVTFPSPTTITETWDGFTAAHTLAGGDLPTDAYTWFAVVTAIDGPPFILDLDISDLRTHSDSQVLFDVTGLVAPGVVDFGQLTFAAVAAPEPSSVSLMLLGVGLLFVVRKRIGQCGLSRAS